MRWILGVDARKQPPGPLELARWLSEVTGDAPDRAFVAVHVLDEQHLRTMLRHHHLDALVEEETAAAARLLASAFPGAKIPLDVVQATTIGEGLEEARVRHGAAGVIVARAAPRGSRRPFPLGRVARRLLRRLASPVVVVPPDLAASAVGAGPVVALSSLGEDSVEACRLARALAERARRELAIVHVEPGRRAEGAADLARWIERHALWPDQAAVIEGDDVASAALAFAEARRAPLVAVGAHRAGGALGDIAPRLWRALAAHARDPVLVVPAPEALVRPIGWGDLRDAGAPPGLGP